MDLREYLTEHIADVLAELCQYQKCDNCSIGSLFEDCPLWKRSIEEALDCEVE